MQKNRHESLLRLMEVAQRHGITTPSGVAMALDESEQVVTNWGRRGVSKPGALKAAVRFGCSANWILTGVADAVVGYSTEALALAWLLDQIPDRLSKIRANSAATKAILDVIQESDVLPSSKPVVRTSLEKPLS